MLTGAVVLFTAVAVVGQAEEARHDDWRPLRYEDMLTFRKQNRIDHPPGLYDQRGRVRARASWKHGDEEHVVSLRCQAGWIPGAGLNIWLPCIYYVRGVQETVKDSGLYFMFGTEAMYNAPPSMMMGMSANSAPANKHGFVIMTQDGIWQFRNNAKNYIAPLVRHAGNHTIRIDYMVRDPHTLLLRLLPDEGAPMEITVTAVDP